ncbi:MAG TPA: tetratricopeptide repeat protein [Thermoanaerobaculia bacterium]|nr:tetratricopeptide repeat protein [Thermoanaerobaculia bacterium]
MREEQVARIKVYAEWLANGLDAGFRDAAEILSLPAVEWNRWLAAHPEAATLHTLQAMLHAATNDARALSIAELVLTHAARISLPEDAEPVRRLLHAHAWRLQGSSLRDGGDLHGALQAYERSIEAFRVPPLFPAQVEAVEREAAEVRQELEKEAATHALVGRLLEETPVHGWQSLAGREELHDPDVLGELSRQFQVRVHQSPLDALAVTQLGVAIASRLAAETSPRVRHRLADAWKDHATALRMLARYEESLAAFDRAEQMLPRSEELARANLAIGRGTALQEAGRLDEAMSLLGGCRAVFEKYGDRRGLLFCGISEGALLHRMERYLEACDTYRALLPLAEDGGDLDALASIHNNIGYSAVELGDFALAERHLSEAVRRFGAIERPLHVARAELARGRLMIRKGLFERSIEHLHGVREVFLRHNLVEEAGLCGLDVVEAHLAAGARIEAEAFARQIVREFTAARLNARAITALLYLSEAIAARNASGTTVRDVHRFIRSLRANPESEFVAAS